MQKVVIALSLILLVNAQTACVTASDCPTGDDCALQIQYYTNGTNSTALYCYSTNFCGQIANTTDSVSIISCLTSGVCTSDADCSTAGTDYYCGGIQCDGTNYYATCVQ